MNENIFFSESQKLQSDSVLSDFDSLQLKVYFFAVLLLVILPELFHLYN